MGLSLRGTTSGAVDINAPAVAGDNTITLPGNNGAANQFYKNSGTAGIVTYSSMVEDSSGRIGIGLTNPEANLHVEVGSGEAIRASASGANQHVWARFIAGSPSNTDLRIGADSASGGVYGVGGGAVVWNAGNGPLAFGTNNAERLRITSAGNVGIGTDNPSTNLHVVGSVRATGAFDLRDTSGNVVLFVEDASNDARISNQTAGEDIIIRTTPSGGSATERLRIDSSGRLLVGTTASETINGDNVNLQIKSTGASAGLSIHRSQDTTSPPYISLAHSRAGAIVSNNDDLGAINFFGHDGTDLNSIGAAINCQVDGTPGSNDMPGRLVFATTADGASSSTERMRINSSGVIAVAGALSAVTPATGVANGGILIRPTTVLNNAPFLAQASSAAESVALVFANSNGVVGSIRTSGSATQYNTSSDYRLKENVVDITDGITRVKQLSPRRFNFIADDTKIVDGFIAHEAQVIVPECVTGVKDEVDDEGNPVMQGIDQSKLVPLLTAALQEAIAKIETLETQNASLESRLTALEG